MRPIPAGLVVVLLALAVLPTGSVARAEDDGQPLDAPTDPAQALLRAEDLSTRAVSLYQAGKYAEAVPLAREALELWEKALGPEHLLITPSLNNLALLLLAQGVYEEAKLLCERSLAVVEMVFGPENPCLVPSLNNLASVLQAQGAYGDARPIFERALAIQEKAHGPEHPDVATSLNNLAALLRARGAYEEAKPLQERALAILEKARGPEHPDVATSLNNLAVLLADLGAYEEARPLLERALVIQEEVLGPNHPAVALTLCNLAHLHRVQGHHEPARGLLKRALAITEGNLRQHFAGLQGPARLALIRSLRHRLDEWLGLAPHVGLSGHAEVLRFKGMAARAAAAERRLARVSPLETAERIEEQRAVERRLSRLVNSMPPVFRKEAHARWQETYAKAAADRERRALALARDFAPYRAGLERLDLTLQDVQARLGEDEVLVDCLRSRGRYLAWVVVPDGDTVRVDLGSAETIEEAATAFARMVVASRDHPRTASGGVEQTLRDLVFAPIEARLPEGTRTIHLCPDAALAAVPFAALPGHEEGSFLGDDYLLVHHSMAQDLVPWAEDPQGGRGALLVGDVDYGRARPPSEGETAPEPGLLAAADRAPRGRSFLPLPETRGEVETVKGFVGDGAVLLLGPEATEARVRRAAKGRRLLHFATHGFVRSDLMRGLGPRRDAERWLGADIERHLATGYDPMLLAGLAMAGANPREGGVGDDGILTALEASYLDLDGVALVVLSACETALGRAESGQGVIGLVQGFQMAGAKQVLGSLWKVDDEATRAWMARFHELWSPKGDEPGLPAAEALRRAQVHVRSKEKWAHPYYWAAWALWSVGS